MFKIGDPTGSRSLSWIFSSQHTCSKKSHSLDPHSDIRLQFDYLSQRFMNDTKTHHRKWCIFDRVTLPGVEPGFKA